MAQSEVEKSYGRCCVNPKFLDRFYEIFLASHPAIGPMFAKTDFTKQKAALRSGLAMMVMHGGGKSFGTKALDRIADSHSKTKLNVSPELYPFWINSLLKAIKECDPEYTPTLEAEWRKILEAGANHIAAGYHK
jgi:hemoglobin-like flavoprotein